MGQSSIVIKGAREHNLKNVDVEYRAISLSLLRGSPVLVKAPWPSTPFMQKVSVAMWRVFPAMRANFWVR